MAIEKVEYSFPHENEEKDIERSAISLSAVILSKLNYKNSTTEQIKEKLSKFSMSNNV